MLKSKMAAVSKAKAGVIVEHQAFFQHYTVSCNAFIQTQRHRSAMKCLCRVFSYGQQNHVSWVWNTLEVELVSTHGRAYCSSGSVLILIYQINAHAIKKRKCACERVMKNALHLSMNSTLSFNLQSLMVQSLFSNNIASLECGAESTWRHRQRCKKWRKHRVANQTTKQK